MALSAPNFAQNLSDDDTSTTCRTRVGLENLLTTSVPVFTVSQCLNSRLDCFRSLEPCLATLCYSSSAPALGLPVGDIRKWTPVLAADLDSLLTLVCSVP